MTAAQINVSTASDEDRYDWNELLRTSPRSEVYQHYDWKGLYEGVFGHDCYYLLARDNDARVCGLLPLVHLKSRVFGNFLVSLPCFNYGGILAENPATCAALQNSAETLAVTLGASHVELRHRSDQSMDLPYRDDKVSMNLSLPQDEDELWKGFSSKLRAQIRRPKKEGAICRDGGVELLDEFYGVFARNMRDLGTPVYPKNFFAQIFDRFTDISRLFVVRIGEQPVAAGMTIGHQATLEIPFASSLREFNRCSPNMLLYWSVLQYAVCQGFKSFDFGRSSKDSGPYRFKKQWGAEEQGLSWHYILHRGDQLPQINPDNPKYRLAVNIWRRLPVSVANLLGPRVVKHLP